MGRRRKQGKRTPSGRISRAGMETPSQKALDARSRHYGITKTQAGNPMCATVIGRLCMKRALPIVPEMRGVGHKSKDLTHDHLYEAYECFSKKREAYLSAIHAKTFSTGSYLYDFQSEEDYEEWVAKAKYQYGRVCCEIDSVARMMLEDERRIAGTKQQLEILSCALVSIGVHFGLWADNDNKTADIC